MKTNKRNLALAVIAATAALLLGTPTAALAAPFVPDGSVPYGANTICFYNDSFEFVDPSLSECSPIPTFAWDTADIPESTGWLTNVNITDLDWVQFVGNEGSISGAEGAQNGVSNTTNFFVAPSNPEAPQV